MQKVTLGQTLIYQPAALKWFMALKVTMTSALSILLSWQILYSWRVLVLSTVIFICHMHAGDGIQDHFVPPPEVFLKQQLQKLLVGQRWGPTSAWIHSFLNAVEGHQGQELILKDLLSVVDHIVNHHSPKIPIRKIGDLLCSGCTHQHRSLDGREHAATCTIWPANTPKGNRQTPI